MKIVIQRVSHSSVEVEQQIVGKIGTGLNLLVGFGQDDTEALLSPMAKKLANLRIFPDEQGRFHHSVLDIKGEVLAIPQFTLYAETKKGRRPDFFSAMPPMQASSMFDSFCEALLNEHISKVARGVFGADMKVRIENDGPVTIVLASEDL